MLFGLQCSRVLQTGSVLILLFFFILICDMSVKISMIFDLMADADYHPYRYNITICHCPRP